tara:strand:+ start:2315 stop:2938 length:624 start_codon:yes stop_codon:yes gene_type:complete
MGFDLHGINPMIHTEVPKIMVNARGKDGWVKWEGMTQKDKDAYFEAKDKHDKENPGIYFRNNSWWWRPLWFYICTTCDDILSEHQAGIGNYNDGVKIRKTKAKRIAARIRKLDKIGAISKFEQKYVKDRDEAIKHNKKVDKTMEKFKKAMELKYKDGRPPAKYDKEDNKTWDRIYSTRMIQASYPFDRQNVLEFGIFCDESGGFEIW